MSDKVCLAIGVGDAPPLDYLRGAINGAHAMADWAGAHGYETRLLTDEADPVDVDDVKARLEELLAPAPAMLLLYFAGHGISVDVADDLWLLSEWHEKGVGISVPTLTRKRLPRYGLKRLIVISDACRTLRNELAVDVEKHSVLEKGPFDLDDPQTDAYYAASSARAAWMIPGATPEDSRCIFSGVLNEALSGAHEEAFEEGNRQKPITNFSLADFLEVKVPVQAALYGIDLKPSCSTSIRPPNNIYLDHGPATPPPQVPWPSPDNAATSMGPAVDERRLAPPPGSSWSTKNDTRVASAAADRTLNFSDVQAADKKAAVEAENARQEKVQDALSAFAADAANRPDHFESGAGFTITGATAVRAWLGPPATAKRFSGNVWRVEEGDPAFAHPWWSNGWPIRAPLPLLLQLEDDRFAGAAVLPNFVLSFSLDESGVQAVIFREMYNPYAPETELTLAELLAEGLSASQAPAIVERLRYSKHADPTLGVLAAWLHDAVGDVANIHRTAYFYANRGEPIPFDIALLGRLRAKRDDRGLVHLEIPATEEDVSRRDDPRYMWRATPAVTGVLAGAFPWIRQGWVRLDPDGQADLYPPGLAELAVNLLPAPFTTLDKTGGDALVKLLFKGD